MHNMKECDLRDLCVFILMTIVLYKHFKQRVMIQALCKSIIQLQNFSAKPKCCWAVDAPQLQPQPKLQQHWVDVQITPQSTISLMGTTGLGQCVTDLMAHHQ